MFYKRLIFTLVIFLVVINIYSVKRKKKKNNESKFPKLIEEMILPSGFNNEYVKKLLEKEEIDFKKPTLRIVKFDIPPVFLKSIKDPDFNMIEVLKSKITETNRYNLLATDEDLESIYQEQSKVGDEDFEDSSDVKYGHLKISSYVLTGEVIHSYPVVKQEGGYFLLKVSVGASITITNTTTGEIEYTKSLVSVNEEQLFVTADGMIIKGPRNLTEKPLNSLNSTGDDIDLSPQYHAALNDCIDKIVYFIEEKYPIMGEVISFKKGKIITTVSEKNGIKAGDYIFIVRIEDELSDSSGKFVGFDKETIGAAEVISVEKNISVAKIVKLADEEVEPVENDIVISLPSKAR